MLKITEENQSRLLLNIKFIRENLPLILLIPTIIGGLQQTIQLIIISPSLIRFFSITQLVIDGLFIILYFTFIVILPAYLAKKTMSFSKNQSSKSFIISSIILIILIISNLLIYYIIREKIDYNTALDFIVNFILFFFCSCIIFNYSPSEHTDLVNRKSYLLTTNMIFITAFLGFLIAQAAFTKITSTTPIDNFKILHKKFENQGKIEILYFNDTYIFLRVNSKELHVEKLETIF